MYIHPHGRWRVCRERYVPISGTAGKKCIYVPATPWKEYRQARYFRNLAISIFISSLSSFKPLSRPPGITAFFVQVYEIIRFYQGRAPVMLAKLTSYPNVVIGDPFHVVGLPLNVCWIPVQQTTGKTERKTAGIQHSYCPHHGFPPNRLRKWREERPWKRRKEKK